MRESFLKWDLISLSGVFWLKVVSENRAYIWETNIQCQCQGFQKDCRFCFPLSTRMLCSRRRQRRTSPPTERMFYSQRYKWLVKGRGVDTYLLLNLGTKIDPLCSSLNFLRCAIHGEHPQLSLIWAKNSRCHHFFSVMNCKRLPTGTCGKDWDSQWNEYQCQKSDKKVCSHDSGLVILVCSHYCGVSSVISRLRGLSSCSSIKQNIPLTTSKNRTV